MYDLRIHALYFLLHVVVVVVIVVVVVVIFFPRVCITELYVRQCRAVPDVMTLCLSVQCVCNGFGELFPLLVCVYHDLLMLMHISCLLMQKYPALDIANINLDSVVDI